MSNFPTIPLRQFKQKINTYQGKECSLMTSFDLVVLKRAVLFVDVLAMFILQETKKTKSNNNTDIMLLKLDTIAHLRNKTTNTRENFRTQQVNKRAR